MKKLITTIAIIFSLQSFGQDSTVITISPQTRDLEFATQYMANSTQLENIWDSVKIKFRVQNPPTGNTTVAITGYTIDFYNLFTHLKYDALAIKNNCTSRIETLLRALNQAHLTAKLDALDVADNESFQSLRQFWRQKLRRN